ncbi:leucine-rich repeat domain-containing protein [Aquimarina sediminis]|uniref:hypothetical protein n=1 Tax=Aquimarina sediminis TaxID=2070536 RepID=UPI000CA08050|nr:hypothetical protein [Aquimarina sediminis]
MNNKYISIIKNAPDGFGLEETDTWQKTFPRIDSWKEISHLYKHPQLESAKDFTALSMFTYQSYFHDVYESICSQNSIKDKIFGGKMEAYFQYKELKPEHHSLTLFEDKSYRLDFSNFNALRKLNISRCRNAVEIIVPKDNTLEGFEVIGGQQLKIINGLESLSNVKYLSIKKCNKFKNFNLAGELKQLVFLNLSENKGLTHINFLEGHPNIVFLYLIGCSKVIKNPSTIEILKSLPKLKFLRIAANMSERANLKEKLPNIHS